MIKLVSILAPVFLLNVFDPYGTLPTLEASVEFSNPAIRIESGQPVFTKDTHVWISNPKQEVLKLYINEEEKETQEAKIELSDLTDLKEGTYTVVLHAKEDEKVFGFTIQ